MATLDQLFPVGADIYKQLSTSQNSVLVELADPDGKSADKAMSFVKLKTT